MSNDYFMYGNTLLPGEKARAEDVASEFQSVASGFELLPQPRPGGDGFLAPIHIPPATAPTHAAQLNQMQDVIDRIAEAENSISTIETAENNVNTAVQEVETLNTATISVANFKGNWTDLTGALAMPASVAHQGSVWLLTADLADVTLSEPGVTADWAYAYFPAIAGQGGNILTVSPGGSGVEWAETFPATAGNEGKVLTVNSGATGVEWGFGDLSDYQEFTASGTWTKPDGVRFVYVEVVGGGASGAVGHESLYVLGGGGGGYADKLFLASDITNSVTVTVGAGGAAKSRTVNSTTDRTYGDAGGDTTFGAYLTGKRAASATAPSISRNESGSGSYGGASNYAGGGGGGYVNVGNYGHLQAVGGRAVKGGGGGGAGGLPGGSSVTGGDGGPSRFVSTGDAIVPENGAAPGGGGGSASTGGTTGQTVTGGAGGDGVVRIWSW